MATEAVADLPGLAYGAGPLPLPAAGSRGPRQAGGLRHRSAPRVSGRVSLPRAFPPHSSNRARRANRADCTSANLRRETCSTSRQLRGPGSVRAGRWTWRETDGGVGRPSRPSADTFATRKRNPAQPLHRRSVGCDGLVCSCASGRVREKRALLRYAVPLALRGRGRAHASASGAAEMFSSASPTQCIRHPALRMRITYGYVRMKTSMKNTKHLPSFIVS